ncbi:MAG: helix-turn-helix domain-containing protein [Bryobacteraceae bacterium]|jgi:cytoskeleton protein RodZ
MTPIGESLRRERLKKNISLDQISQELKLSHRLLEAIECDDFSKLPGGVFARSFVRQYARLVGLDEEEIGNAVRELLEQPPPEPTEAPVFVETPALPVKSGAKSIQVARLEEWQGVADARGRWFSSVRSLALVLLVMVVCSGVYTWWQHERRRASQPTRVIAQTSAPKTETPAQGTMPQPVPAPAAPTTPAAGAGAATPESRTSPPADASPAPQAASAVLRASDVVGGHGTVRVDLTAEEPVWILVRSDGKYLYSGTLSPNQSRTVEAASNVFLEVGNAGGVTITLNGKPIGSVGSHGEVRNLQLTSGGFQIVAARNSGAPLDPL